MKKKIFYGWIIVGTCCLVMATTMGIITNCNSLFIRPVAEELGISRQTISLMISLQSLGTMIASLFTGKIFNGHNTITVMKTAVIVMTAAYFLNSFANSILLLYVTYFINGIMLALVTTLPISFLINNWFIDRTGYALGLASMGSGFGGAFFNSLAGHIMNSAGWRNTYRILALFILVIAVPCIFFVLKLRPEETREKPYREQGENETDKKQELTGFTFAEACKTPILWILYALAVIIGICLNSMYTTVSPHLQDKGYSLVFSANVLSACMLVMAGGKIMIGRIFDRYGAKAGFFCACAALTAATVGMRFCTFVPALALIVAGVGFGCIFGAVVYPLTIPLVFGKRDYQAIIGPASALFSLGGIIGPLFAGKVYDMTGAYDLCYTIDIIVMLTVIAIILKVLPSKDQQFS